MKLRTMGRWPTKSELIEYYSRDDICAVIYYQSKRWKILMEFGDKYLLEPASERDTREKILQQLHNCTKGVKETERLPFVKKKFGQFRKYPTMHILKDNGKRADIRYHFMLEQDFWSWSVAFHDMEKVLDVLDAHDVYYQIKFSGHRSLHLLIPAETLPKTFHGRSINEEFDLIKKKIQKYLPQPEREIPLGLRVVYSTHPKGGMVSLPLRRKELPNFQPWMANIYTVAVDFDWFEIPENAVERNEKFLYTVFDNTTKNITVSTPVFEPLPVKAYTGDTPFTEAEVLKGIDSEQPQERVAATRAALIQNRQLPQEKLRSLFHDTEPDVVWFAMEIAMGNASQIAIEDIIHLFDQNRFDGNNENLIGLGYQLLTQSTERVDALCNYFISQGEINPNTIVAARMIAELDWLDKDRIIRSFVEPQSSSKIAYALQKTIESGSPYSRVRLYIELIQKICKRYSIEESTAFSEARKLLIPQLLRHLREEDANPDYISILMQIILGDAPKITIEDIIHLLRQEDDYLKSLGYQLLTQSTVQVDALCDYLLSQDEINRNTITIVRLLRELDEQSFVELPMRIRATSQHEWFEKVWVVCASAICLDWRPSLKTLFENAHLQAKRYEVGSGLKSDVGAGLKPAPTDKIHQLELLLKLHNREAHTKVQDVPLFSAAEALIQYGRDLRPIVMAMLDCKPSSSNNVYYGAIRLLTRLWWNDSIDLLIQRLDSHSSRRKSVLKAIVDIGKPAVPKLIEILRDKHLRGFVPADLFVEIGEPAVAELIAALKDEESEVRWHAACALGKLGELAKSAVPSLIELLSDENEEVRSHAARALKLIGTPEAIKAVEGL